MILKSLPFTAFLLLLISCAETEKDQSAPEEEVIEVPDSTAYFDSAYAPLAYQIDTFFTKRHEAKTFYGNVLIAERGRVIYENSFGLANLKTKDSLTLDHTFQLASASKPFTAVAVLKLIEEGKVKLDDPVEKYVPNFPYTGIDVEQLLCHRSGLSQYTHFCDAPDSIWPDKHKTITNKDVLHIMNQLVPMPNYAPDTKYYYCNTNFLLLAEIIEHASGLSYSDYMKKNIFDPLEMSSTVIYTRDNKDELVLPTAGYNGAFNPVIDIYLNGCTGDKGIYTNVHDFLKFDRALHSGKIIEPATLDSAFVPRNKTFKTNQNYGYGFRLMDVEDTGMVPFHTGWWKGYRTYYIHVPKSDRTIIVLTHIKRGPFFKVDQLVNLLN